jgi:two-component system cell cycle sensor histidine kinase/response regulator CckA
MKDQEKTREQLVGELTELRLRIADLDALEAERERLEVALRELEERYRRLAESSGDMIFTVDREGVFQTAEGVRLREFGLTSDDVVGQSLYDLFPEEEARWYHEKHLRVFESGIPMSYEHTFEFAGLTRTDLTTIYPVQDGRGKVGFVGVVCRDMTERKRTEEALRENQELLNNILTASSVGIAHAKDRNIVWANEAMVEMFGFTAEEEYLGKDTEMLYASEEEYRRVGRISYEQQRAGKVVEFDARFRRQDGSLFDGYVKVNALDPLDPIKGVIVSIIDITGRKQAEKALRESETRFRTLFKYAPFGAALVDMEGRPLLTNLALQDMLGYSEDQFKEMDFSDFTHPDEVGANQNLFNELLEGKRDFYQVERRLFDRDGDLIWTSLGVSIIRDVKGEPQTIIGMMKDITERKLAAEERERLLAQIRGQAQRMQQILDTVPEGVLLLDDDGYVVLVNPVAERDLVVLAGARAGDRLTHLGDRPLAKLLTSPPKGLWHEVAADGRSFQVIARPIESAPSPGGWVMVIRDVTQQREIQQRIQQQERLAAVGQLAAGIAHDFNNIMATVVLYAQMTARMEELPAVVQARMETINQQAVHATKLIQQILDFSRRAVLERRPIDLAPLLKEHVKLLERTLPESVEIRLECEPDEYATPFTVNADPTRIQQMVTNLALNARDAMRSGGELNIRLERVEVEPKESPLLPEMAAGEWVRMTVSDTGTGIPPDALPHIFEPFFTTKAPLGSGLGLAQVHGIVGSHEGRIDVETQVGKGTTFTIYLPVYLSEPSPLLSRAELSELPTGQGETILVVEDNAVVQKALADSLELLNYQVRKASNGQEALAVLEQRKGEIALVLSDVVMPRMSGIALLHAMRERGLVVRVVMLTGHPLKKEMERLRAHGMTDWLPKPPQLEQLAEVVARALGTA